MHASVQTDGNSGVKMCVCWIMKKTEVKRYDMDPRLIIAGFIIGWFAPEVFSAIAKWNCVPVLMNCLGAVAGGLIGSFISSHIG